MGRGLENYRNNLRQKKKEEQSVLPPQNTNVSQGTGLSKYRSRLSLNLDTLQSDLTSLSTTIDSVYNGWQSRETMENTRLSVQNMYNRLGKYQEYQKAYGGTDLSQLHTAYKSVLDSWDDVASHYGQFKDADSYNKAIEKTKKEAEAYEGMTKADLNALQTEIADLEEIYKTAQQHDSKVKGLTRRGANFDSRARGKGTIADKITTAENELNEFLGSYGYESTDALKNALDEKKLYFDNAKKIQDGIALAEKESAMASSAQATEGLKKWDEFVAGRDNAKTEEKKLPDWIRNLGYIDNPTAQLMDIKREDTSYQEPQDDWTQEERNIFGAYYLENPESAYEYAAKLNNQKALAEKEKGKQKYSDKATSGVGSEILHTAGAVLTSPLAMADYLDDVTDIAAGRRTIVEEGAVSPFDYSQAVTSGVSNKLNNMYGTLSEDIPIIGGKGVGDAYGLGTSILQSAVSASTLGPYGTLISYFGQGAASATDDAIARGADAEQALMYGTIVGAAEGVSEMIGIDNLLKVGKASTLKGFFKNVLKQAGAEGLEEGFSSVVDKIADNFVMKDKSNLNAMVSRLVAQGMSYEEAKNKAWLESVEEVAFDVLSGAISGALHAAPKTAAATAMSHFSEVNAGKNIRANDRIGEVFDIASNPEVASAYEAYTEYANKGINAENVSDAQLGKLAYSAVEEAYNIINSETATAEQKAQARKTIADLDVYAQKPQNRVSKKEAKKYDDAMVQGIIDAGLDNDTNSESYRLAMEYDAKVKSGKKLSTNEISKLVEANERAYRNEDAKAVTDRLTELGETADVPEVARIIERKMNGEAITADEYQAVKDSKYGNQVLLENTDADIVSQAEAMETDDGELFMRLYDGKTDAEAYANSFNLVAEYAKAPSISTDYVLEHRGVLTPSQTSQIYNHFAVKASKEAKIKFNQEAQKQFADAIAKMEENLKVSREGFVDTSVIDFTNSSTEGKVNWNDLKPRQQQAVTFVSGLFKAMGANVVFVDKTKKFNGMYHQEGDTVFVDVYAGMDIVKMMGKDSIIPTTAHELTHMMEVHSPEEFKELADMVLDFLAETKQLTRQEIIATEIARLDEKHPDAAPHSEKDAISEIVARTCEDMLSASKEGRRLFESLSEEQQKSFADKVKEIFKKLTEWLDKLLNSYESTSDEAKAIRGVKSVFDEVSARWDKMLADIAVGNGRERNVTLEKGKVLEQARKFDKKSKSRYNEYQTNAMVWARSATTNPGDLKILNANGKYFALIEATDDGFVEIAKGRYEEVLVEYERAYKEAADEIYGNLESIETDQRRDIWDMQYVEDGGNDVGDGKQIEGKRLQDNSARNDEYLRNGHKGESKITDKDILYSDRDSIGRELSSGQKEYFKNSTVRDDKGSLLVMYRGDSDNFTIFDRKKSKPSNLYGRGFYFTNTKSHAEQYGEAKEYYLDIKKPLSPGQNAITKNQMLNFLKAIENDGEDYDLYNYGQDATAESVLNEVWGKDDFAMLQDINAGAIGDLVAAIELFNDVNGTNYDGIILPTETVTFNSEQAKLTSNLNPTKDKNIHFQMRESVEETRDLIAVHNVSPEKLLKTLKLGGLPMPSIAITRAREGYNNFGDISLVFSKDTIDPELARSNKVYSGDAWTPTYPQVAYKLNTKAQEQIKKKIDALVPKDIQKDLGGLHLDSSNMEDSLNRNSGDMVSAYRNNSAMMYAFLKDNNVNIELPTEERPFYRYGEVSNKAVASFAHGMVEGLKTVNSLLEQHSSKLMADEDLIKGIAAVLNEEVMSTTDANSEAYQKLVENPLFKPEDIDLSTVLGMLEAARKYFNTNGRTESRINYREAKTLIDEKTNMIEYESWLKDLFSDVIGKEGLRNNKDLFTPSGNRRSFDALHYEHTLENVVKAMKAEGAKGIGGFGGGNIFGASTREYGSIADIRADAENRMELLPESKYDEIKKGFSDRLFELASSLPKNKDSFSAIDDAANMLIEAVAKFKTKSGMANYLRSESQGWANYNDYVVDDLIQLVSEIRQMPVAYFEAKPQRAVGFDEIKAVIMPAQESYEDDLTDVKSELEKLGVSIIEYEYGDNNARIKALNSLESVRFSERETTNIYDIMGERDRLKKRNEILEADIKRLKEMSKLDKKVTMGAYLDRSKLSAIAKYIKKISNSTIEENALVDRLNEVYLSMRNAADYTWDEIYGRFYSVAEEVLAESKPKTLTDDFAKMILKDIRATRISLTESQKKEAQYIFGKNWNRHFFNRVTITDSGASIDSQWQEWAKQYPYLFKTDISDADMIRELYDVIITLQEASVITEEYDEQERTNWLAMEIYNKHWTANPLHTTADKYDAQIKVLKFEHRKAMEELRTTLTDSLARQKLADDIHYGQKINQKNKKIESLNEQHVRDRQLIEHLREQRDEGIARAKQHGRDMLDKYKDNAERKTILQRTIAGVKQLSTKISTNSKDVHIPETMKPVVIEFLNAVDLSSQRLLKGGAPTLNDMSNQKAFGKVKAMANDNITLKKAIQDVLAFFRDAEKLLSGIKNTTIDRSLVALDIGLIEDIENMLKNIDDISTNPKALVLNELSTSNLRTLNAMVQNLNRLANIADKALASSLKGKISALALETQNDLSEYGKRQTYHKTIEETKKFFNWSQALPVNAFKRLGNAGTKVFEALLSAQGQCAFNRQAVMDFNDELFKKYGLKNIKKWRKEVKKFEVVLPGESEKTTIEMPVSYIMSLYCVSKQEDAQRHLFGRDASGDLLTYEDEGGNVHQGGGMTIKGYKAGWSGLKVNETLDSQIVDENIVKQITSVLTEEQIAVADALQGYMNTQGSNWGDAVSMALYGIKKFGVKDYFPIQVSSHEINSDIDKENTMNMFAILNYSFTKDRNPNAKQSIEIGDIFEVYANHMDMMAIYNAYALTIYDVARWFGYKGKTETGNKVNVTLAIEKAFGKSAISYITNLIKDLNGQHESSRLGIVSKIYKNVKVAMVGNSLSTILLQPTAFIRAGTVLNPINLVKAFALPHLVFRGIQRAKQYSGLALLKSQGYFETGISSNTVTKMLKDESWMEKAQSFSLLGAEIADNITWGCLWNACELEVRAKQKNLKVGSKEYFEAVGKQLDKVICQTQVVDSPLTKSDFMRSPDNKAKEVAQFASELTVTYNTLFECVYQLNLDAKKMGKAKALKHNAGGMSRAISAHVLTSIVVACISVAVRDFRYDDDDDEETYFDKVKQAFFEELNILAKIPYIKDAVSLFLGYDTTRTETMPFVSFFKAREYREKAIENQEKMISAKSDKSAKNAEKWMKIYKSLEFDEYLKAASYAGGYGLYNQWREVRALLRFIGLID